MLYYWNVINISHIIMNKLLTPASVDYRVQHGCTNLRNRLNAIAIMCSALVSKYPNIPYLIRTC